MTKKAPRKNTIRESILASLPGTQREVRAKTGASPAMASRWILYLRTTGEAHIGGWAEPPKGGTPVCVYHPGPGADVMCTVRELTPEEFDRRVSTANRRMQKNLDRKSVGKAVVVRRDPFTAAFFGPTGMA